MTRISHHSGCWGFEKCSLRGVMGMEARLEQVKEKVLVIGVDSTRHRFFNRCCSEGQTINGIMIKGDVEVKRGIF